MIINGLKWLTNFLETRFPEKVTPVSVETYRRDIDALSSLDDAHATAIEKQDVEINKMKKQIEVLNLRVGLARPIPHGLMEKRNG